MIFRLQDFKTAVFGELQYILLLQFSGNAEGCVLWVFFRLQDLRQRYLENYSIFCYYNFQEMQKDVFYNFLTPRLSDSGIWRIIVYFATTIFRKCRRMCSMIFSTLRQRELAKYLVKLNS